MLIHAYNVGCDANDDGNHDDDDDFDDNERSDSGYESLDDSHKRGRIAMSARNLPTLTKAPGMLAAIVLTAGLMVFEQASGMAAILYFGGMFLHVMDRAALAWVCQVDGARV